MGDLSTHNVVTKTSGCNVIDSKELEFLDRHHVACDNNQALLSFKMTRSGCSGGNQQYQYTCGDVPVSNVVTKTSGCNPIEGKKLEFLDRHHVACDNNQALLSFKMTNGGCSGNNEQYQYTCGSITGATSSASDMSDLEKDLNLVVDPILGVED